MNEALAFAQAKPSGYVARRQPYMKWLQTRIAELRLEQRRAQWRRYSASAKGRARQDRYENTVTGQFKRTIRRTRYHSASAADSLAALLAAQQVA